jgi:CelD/BcsL family acetyltransferase involved in cellulose biosynthesis
MPIGKHYVGKTGDSVSQALELDIVSDFDTLKQEWIQLENAAECSAYQRFAFLKPWLETEGDEAASKCAIITGRLEGRLVLAVPTNVVKIGPFRVLCFLGGTHCNINMALIEPDILASLSDKQLEERILDICKSKKIADALVLMNMPGTWAGKENPMLFGAARRAMDDCYVGALDADYDTLLTERRNNKSLQTIRRKLRKLQAAGTTEFREISDTDEAHRVVDVLIRQKCDRFDRMGIINTFSRHSAQQFLHRLVDCSENSTSRSLELCVLTIDGEYAAIFGGASHQGRFTSYISSIREDELAKFGSGEHLLNYQVEKSCERGLTVFDLGIGEAVYKKIWCKDIDPLYDVYRPLNLLGYLPYFLYQSRLTLKKQLRSHPKIVSRLRKIRHALTRQNR